MKVRIRDGVDDNIYYDATCKNQVVRPRVLLSVYLLTKSGQYGLTLLAVVYVYYGICLPDLNLYWYLIPN